MYQNPTEHYESHENFGTQSEILSDDFYSVNPSDEGFSTIRDKNPYTAAPMPTSNDDQHYYTPQFIGHTNPSVNSINSPSVTNGSSSQIQTVEIPGYKIIIIPTPSPLASSNNLDMHQLQQGNTYLNSSSYSVNPPQLSRDQNYIASSDVSFWEDAPMYVVTWETLVMYLDLKVSWCYVAIFNVKNTYLYLSY
ncbi:13751_t:CDS:2 [Funneliformis geosporum]|nr:13751_t:CDS:2 [Funneliformis geosporum]